MLTLCKPKVTQKRVSSTSEHHELSPLSVSPFYFDFSWRQERLLGIELAAADHDRTEPEAHQVDQLPEAGAEAESEGLNLQVPTP